MVTNCIVSLKSQMNVPSRWLSIKLIRMLHVSRQWERCIDGWRLIKRRRWIKVRVNFRNRLKAQIIVGWIHCQRNLTSPIPSLRTQNPPLLFLKWLKIHRSAQHQHINSANWLRLLHVVSNITITLLSKNHYSSKLLKKLLLIWILILIWHLVKSLVRHKKNIRN